MKLAGNRLRLGAAALLSIIVVALVAPIMASAHDSGLRPTGSGSGVGIASDSVACDGKNGPQGNGAITLYGPPGTVFDVDGTGYAVAGAGDTEAYAEITGLNEGSYTATSSNGDVPFTITKCGGSTGGGDNGGGDQSLCPGLEIKHDNLTGATYTVPQPPNGYQWTGASVKAGNQEYWYTAAQVTPGAVLNVKVDTGHDISHIHLCKEKLSPPPPQPDDKVEYGQWSDGSWRCGDTTVSQTRTKTVTPYVLQGNTWMPGTPQVTTETQTRSLTDAEIQSCTPDDREPSYTEWVDGEWDCGDTTVTQTRTRTDYVWVNTSGSTWEQTSTQTVETRTRPLTAAEIQSCKPGDREPSYTEWVDGQWECGDTEVTQTRTRTDYVWLNTGDSTWEQTSAQTVETRTRPLTENEWCPINPPTVVSGYDCLADAPTAFVSPQSDSRWTATGDQDDSALGYRFVVTAKPGYVFGQGNAEVTLTGTIDDSDRSCEAPPKAPQLTTSEECGVVDTYTIPSTLGVVYLVDGVAVDAGTYDLPQGTTIAVTAEAAEGYRLVGSLDESLTGGTVEPCPVDPPTVVSGFDCLADAATAVLSPDSDARWTATADLDDSELGYRFVVTAKPGFVFGEGDTEVTLTGRIDDSNRGCEATPSTPTGSEECGVEDTYVIPTTLGVVYLVDGQPIDAGTYTLAEGETVVVTAQAAEGYRLVGSLDETLIGGTVELCPPVEWPAPTSEPVCGVDNDIVTVPADTDEVTFMDSGWENGVRTVMAHWSHDGSELDSWQFTDAGEDCPPPTTEPQSLDIVAMGPVCLRDAPYIEVTFGDQPQFNGRTATVTFVDLDGNVVGTETATYEVGATARFVYPGATVDAAGNAVDWPGWMFDGDEWVHDPSDAHLRDGLKVVVEVNPTATGSVTYPDPTAACADPAIVPPTPTPADPVVPQGGLPVTR